MPGSPGHQKIVTMRLVVCTPCKVFFMSSRFLGTAIYAAQIWYKSRFKSDGKPPNPYELHHAALN